MIFGPKILHRKDLCVAGDCSHDPNRATNDDTGNGASPTSGTPLVDTCDPKTVLQIIVGTRQVRDVITVKQPCGEIVGDVAKVLKRLRKLSQSSKVISHPRQVGQILFLDLLTAVLRLIGQDRFGLIQETIGVLKWRPQFRRRLQALG